MTDMDHAVEQATQVLIEHPSIPTYGDGSRDVCPSCPGADVAGPNSPSHAAHQARALAEAGLLASLTEWDVEYRSDDGYVSRHTDDVFDETDLSYGQAKEYADAYNDLDSSPGVAVVVRRYVTDWIEA